MSKKLAIAQLVGSVITTLALICSLVWGVATMGQTIKQNTLMLVEVKEVVHNLNVKVYDHEARLAVIEAR